MPNFQFQCGTAPLSKQALQLMSFVKAKCTPIYQHGHATMDFSTATLLQWDLQGAGCRVLIYEPKNTSFWGVCAIEGHYSGPVFHHYSKFTV